MCAAWRAALDGADVVIITFYIGDAATLRADKEIPAAYGIDQAVGDTLGPGGVFRFLRAAPVYAAIVDEIRELCPRARVINYSNPMAMNCWYMARLDVTPVGPLPPRCTAVNRTNVNVQELAVEAALTGDRAHVYHAVMLDPLTSAVLTLERIRALVNELFAAEAAWLPAFARRA